MALSREEKARLIEELRKIYAHCSSTGFEVSPTFIKLGKTLASEVNNSTYRSRMSDEDAETLYQETDRETIEMWLESVEENIELEDRGGTKYRDNEKEFVEDMRSRFEERHGRAKPLTGKQLRWLKSLYDRS